MLSLNGFKNELSQEFLRQIASRRFIQDQDRLKSIKFIDNISGLQVFQLMKFTVFLIISIIFTKSHLTRAEIGSWEMFLFIAGLLSFFWVTGIIQSLLPLYHRNRTYRKLGENKAGKGS